MRAALKKGDIEALRRALTTRQRLFAEEYIVDFKGREAAIRAGYAHKWADKQATILLDHVGVMAYIDHLTKSVEAKAIAINPDWVLQKTVVNINKAEEVTNLSAVFRGLELLARHFGMLKDKQEISGPDGEAIRIQREEVQRDAEAIQALLTHLSQKQHTFVITDKEQDPLG